MDILSEEEFHDLDKRIHRERVQHNNDILMAFVEPATLALKIRENLLIVEEILLGCDALQKSDDGWVMGFSPNPHSYPRKVNASQLVSAEKLMRFTRQPVVYHCGEIIVTFEWRAA